MNPLMQAMGNQTTGINTQAVQQVKQMMKVFRSAGNPQQFLIQAAQQNPDLDNVMKLCNGKNPKDVFYDQCQKMGVDPNYIINQLK